MIISLPVWEQNDGSVVDKNGLIITSEERAHILRSTHALPVFQERGRIKDLIWKWSDIIIDGATWSGKSTWVPIFVREHWLRVVQTVPRVLAAMTCAERISKILLCETGNSDYTLWYKEVWYRTGGGWVSSKATSQLSIHTDGLEMNRQLQSKIYPEVIILDEVQNLSIATELLMFIAKHKLDIQVIIMSATLDPNIYARYMESRGKDISIVSIPWKIFPIEEHYEKGFWMIEKTIELAKQWEHGLHIVSGKARIDKVIAELEKSLWVWYEIVALHAELTKEEQFKITLPPSDNMITRIIVATNVAEESITIPYLKFVVDEWMHKVGRVSPEWIPELRVEAATLANTKQRRGRVWRTQAGKYFRFNDTDLEDLHEYPSAQIENSTLEREILLFEKANMPLYGLVGRAQDRGGEAFLHTIDRNLLNIWYERLAQIGALDSFWKITSLGEDLLTISLDPAHGRMIIEGIIRWYTDELIIIAAMFSVNSFLSKDEKWRQLKNGENKKSDIFTYLDLYDLVTKKRVAQDIIERLVYLGIDREEILHFQQEWNDKALYECVDLAPIGIKNHRIVQIANKVTQLQNSFIDRGIKVDKNKKISGKQIHLRAGEKNDNSIQDILICIASWHPYFTFTYNPEEKRLYQEDVKGQRWWLAFKKAAVSSVNLTDWKRYHGIPFIIGSDEIWEDLWLGSERFFDHQEDHTQWDLNIVSHISEVPESARKECIKTQGEYKSVFPNKRKTDGIEYTNIDDIHIRYNSLIEEFSNWEISNMDFLKYAIPLLVMLKNHKFKKFLENKWMDVIVGMEQRLQKFFIQESISYLPRVKRNIAVTENSFSNDSDIYTDFRNWEQENINAQKKRRVKHISVADAKDIENAQQLSLATNELNREIGLFDGWVSKLDGWVIEKIKQVLIGSMIQWMMATWETYNRLLSSFKTDFWSLTEEERKSAIWETHAVENSQSELNALRTRCKQIKDILVELQNLIKASETKKESDYNTIDINACRNLFEWENTKNKTLTSKTQVERFYKWITTLSNYHLDPSNERYIWEFERIQKNFQEIQRVFMDELFNLETDLEDKRANIQERKLGTFQTRREIQIFFSKYYEESYFQTSIQQKLARVLIEAIHSFDVEWTIEKWISSVLSVEMLKEDERTQHIHQFLWLIKDYNSQCSEIQQEISKYNKWAISTTEDVIILTQKIEASRQTLSNIKSSIYSFSA